jgi:tRNA pseudouridine55 synthase
VTVHSIALESLAPPDFTIRVRCGKGFYVRTLAADLGASLGPGGALATLVRTRVGPYRLEDAVSWEAVQEARAGDALWPRLQPPDSALGAMPDVRLSAPAARAFVNGQSVMHEGASGPVRVYGPDGAFLGIGARRGSLVKPERLLHADSPRPRILPA